MIHEPIAEQRPKRRYQSHRRDGAKSPRVTVVLNADDAAEIKRLAEQRGMSESAIVALIVRERFAGGKGGTAEIAA